jgi:hypothetical protein
MTWQVRHVKLTWQVRSGSLIMQAVKANLPGLAIDSIFNIIIQ